MYDLLGRLYEDESGAFDADDDAPPKRERRSGTIIESLSWLTSPGETFVS